MLTGIASPWIGLPFYIGAATRVSGDPQDLLLNLSSVGSASPRGISMSYFGATANGINISFSKSRGTTFGTIAATNSGDLYGNFNFFGVNSSNAYVLGASISASQTAAAGASFNDTTLTFSVASSSVANRTAFLMNGTGFNQSSFVLATNGRRAAVVNQAANLTLISTNEACYVDATAGPINITLPPPSAGTAGQTFRIMKVDASANAVTIVGTVNGVVNPTLAVRYANKTVQHNGALWFEW